MSTSERRSPRPFHFITSNKPRLVMRLIGNSCEPNDVIIIDLEDGVGDMRAPERTPALRVKARENLVEFLSQPASILSRLHIAVRINNVASDDFGKDLSALQAIPSSAPTIGIVLPKVNSPEDIAGCVRQLTQRGIEHSDIAPIIETKLGIQNIESIAAEAKHHPVKYLAYGHYDYSLDAGCWPVLEYDETGFWEWVAPIIGRIESGGFCTFHSPFIQLNDEATFQGVLRNLARICRREFGIGTITERQTILCNQIDLEAADASGQSRLRPTPARSRDELLRLAREVVDIYEANRRDNLAYSVDAKTGRFIPPHEYLCAKKFLGDSSHGR